MPDIDWNAQIIKTVSKLNSKIFPPIDPLQQQLLNDSKPIYVYTTYLDSYDGRMGSFGQFQLKGVDTHGSTNRDDWEQYHLAQTIPSRLLSWDMSRAGTQVITNAKVMMLNAVRVKWLTPFTMGWNSLLTFSIETTDIVTTTLKIGVSLPHIITLPAQMN